MRSLLRVWAAGALVAGASVASAQEAPPPLPAPGLPDEAEAPEPEPRRQILARIGGRPSDVEEDEAPPAEPLPDDVAFVVPGDLRERQGRLRLPGQDPGPPPPYSLAAGVAFSRHLAAVQVDRVRVSQRFEARLPELQGFRLGLGVAELIGDDFLIELGPRVGFGAFFCDEPPLLVCEAAVGLQPGVIAGETLVDFDLHATLDLRLVVARVFVPAISGGFSFFGGTTVLHLGGEVGFAF